MIGWGLLAYGIVGALVALASLLQNSKRYSPRAIAGAVLAGMIAWPVLVLISAYYATRPRWGCAGCGKGHLTREAMIDHVRACYRHPVHARIYAVEQGALVIGSRLAVLALEARRIEARPLAEGLAALSRDVRDLVGEDAAAAYQAEAARSAAACDLVALVQSYRGETAWVEHFPIMYELFQQAAQRAAGEDA